MSDAVGMVAASAALTQALFGEGGTGVVARLHAAFVRELAQARADAAFAAPAATVASAASDPRRRDGAGLVGRRLASLDVRDVGVADHRRVPDEGRRGGGNGRRDGDGDGDGDEGNAAAIAIGEGEIAAIERALASVQVTLGEPRQVGALHALVLSGRVLDDEPDAPPETCDCRLLVLCLAFDGELAVGRRVWGFGYAEDRLVLTLDARRCGDGEPARSPDVGAAEDEWSLTIGGPPPGGGSSGAWGRAGLRCRCRGGEHAGVAIAVDGEHAPGCALRERRLVAA